ncbi:MAG TPA: TIGR03936 family radical SAM-associated protein [Anaerolineales bacterium]|nr:TIGR03936 family radical SAM-associated protein [Anaerolineales bacterium]
MRLRLKFAKTHSMRFTGHMDLHRSLERALRRAGLPLAYSQGFTKRPKINLASALPLGVTAEAELADIWLDEAVAPGEALDRIRSAAPPGIRLDEVTEVPEDAPKLQGAIRSSDFTVTLLEPLPDLDERIAGILAAGPLPRVRRDKPYDLRPLILDLKRLDDDETGHQRLLMTLLTQEAATGRADEVVEELGGSPLAIRVHRVRIHLTSQPANQQTSKP